VTVTVIPVAELGLRRDREPGRADDQRSRGQILPAAVPATAADGEGTTDDYDERHIWLYSLALRDKELTPLLRQLDAKYPDMMPDFVRQHLAKPHRNSSP